MQVDVAIMGSRLQYAVPQVLDHADALHTFYTDADVGNKRWLQMLLACLPHTIATPAARRFAGRFAPSLSPSKVVSFDSLGLKAQWRQRRARSFQQVLDNNVCISGEFCRAVVQKGLVGADAVYAINGCALEIFAAARRRGIACILEQVSAPMRVYQRLIREELEAWPDWEPNLSAGLDGMGFICREEAEWPFADLILPASKYVAGLLDPMGAVRGKCRVVPLGIDVAKFRPPEKKRRRDSLNVLFVGYVSLRKGIPYLLEALRQLDSTRIHCRVVGRVDIDRRNLTRYLRWIDVLGSVPRLEIIKQFHWADVLVFPSICEGFGMVACEAFASGVPVIATPNSGSIVAGGEDGFIVPLRDSQSIAHRLEQLLRSRELLDAMSRKAMQRSLDFDLKAYRKRLLDAIYSVANISIVDSVHEPTSVVVG